MTLECEAKIVIEYWRLKSMGHLCRILGDKKKKIEGR